MKYLPSLCGCPGFHPDSWCSLTNTSVYLHVYMFPKSNTVLLLAKTIAIFIAILEIDHGQASELPLNTIPKPEGKKIALILNHAYQDNSACVSLISWSQFWNLKNMLLLNSHQCRELSPLKVPSPRSAFLSKDILGQEKCPILSSAGVPWVWFFFWVDVISITQATGYMWCEAELATCERICQFRLLVFRW